MENKKVLKYIELELINFRAHVVKSWIHRIDHKQFHDKSYNEIKVYAKKIMDIFQKIMAFIEPFLNIINPFKAISIIANAIGIRISRGINKSILTLFYSFIKLKDY